MLVAASRHDVIEVGEHYQVQYLIICAVDVMSILTKLSILGRWGYFFLTQGGKSPTSTKADLSQKPAQLVAFAVGLPRSDYTSHMSNTSLHWFDVPNHTVTSGGVLLPVRHCQQGVSTLPLLRRTLHITSLNLKAFLH